MKDSLRLVWRAPISAPSSRALIEALAILRAPITALAIAIHGAPITAPWHRAPLPP